MSGPGRVLFFLFLVMAVQGVYYYPQMPEKMATHFDGAGNANGWMGKTDFLMMFYGLMAFLTVIFVVMPRLIGMFPNSMINLPNKDYWLSPENRAKTMEMIQEHLMWMSVGVIALILGIGQLTFQANLKPVPKMADAAWILLIGFFIFMFFWLVKFFMAFRKPVDGGQGTVDGGR